MKREYVYREPRPAQLHQEPRPSFHHICKGNCRGQGDTIAEENEVVDSFKDILHSVTFENVDHSVSDPTKDVRGAGPAKAEAVIDIKLVKPHQHDMRLVRGAHRDTVKSRFDIEDGRLGTRRSSRHEQISVSEGSPLAEKIVRTDLTVGRAMDLDSGCIFKQTTLGFQLIAAHINSSPSSDINRRIV